MGRSVGLLGPAYEVSHAHQTRGLAALSLQEIAALTFALDLRDLRLQSVQPLVVRGYLEQQLRSTTVRFTTLSGSGGSAESGSYYRACWLTGAHGRVALVAEGDWP